MKATSIFSFIVSHSVLDLLNIDDAVANINYKVNFIDCI